MRKNPVLHADQEHHRILKPLRGVQGHEKDLAGVVSRSFLAGRKIVGVGHQAHPLQKLPHVVEGSGHPDQFGQVLQSPLGLDRPFGAQLVEVAGAVQRRLDHCGRTVLHLSYQRGG